MKDKAPPISDNEMNSLLEVFENIRFLDKEENEISEPEIDYYLVPIHC